jgi:hypothetical protein
MLCVKAGRRMLKPRPLLLFTDPVCWVVTAHYRVVTFDTRLNWSAHVEQFSVKASQKLGVLIGFSP